MTQLLKRPLKLYLDTSVPNFLFTEDEPKRKIVTQRLFDKMGSPNYVFFISGVVLREIEKAPSAKRDLLLEVLKGVKVLELTEEAEELAQAYLRGGAIPKSSADDARHIAVAACQNLDAVVSWNFKHLVN